MEEASSLLERLRDRDPAVRIQAVQSTELVSLIKARENSDRRGHLIEALGTIGEIALNPLLALFEDPAFHMYLEDFARAFRRIGRPAQDALRNLLGSANVSKRHRIAILLGHCGDTSVTSVILDAITNDGDWRARCMAAEAFIYIPTSDALDRLIEALDDPNHTVRISATKALGRIADPRAIPALQATAAKREHQGNVYSSDLTVEYYATSAIRVIQQWSQKKG